MPRASSSKSSTKAIKGRYTSIREKQCGRCHEWFNSKGIKSHLRKCNKEEDIAKVYAEQTPKRPASSPLTKTPKRGRLAHQPDPNVELPRGLLFGSQPGGSALPEDEDNSTPPGVDVPSDNDCFINSEDRDSIINAGPILHADPPVSADTSSIPPDSADSASGTLRTPQVDDIKVEYHIAAGIPAAVYAFEDFKRDADMPNVNLDPLSKPWEPFASRTDFEFAELAHEAHLNKRQVAQLLELIKTISSQKDLFTFQSSDDVDRAWEKAKLRHPTFESTKFSVEYKGEPQQFTLHSRSVWDWIIQQVKNPLLAPHFHWDAQRLSKYDGEKWVRFFDEPWTANKFARVQQAIIKINPNGKPLAIILWADTSKLSTFGSQKGHFIVARIGNLSGPIRNGGGLGGGRIVGFVPIVNEDPKEKKKPKYVDFKNAVYHEAFRIFLQEIAKLSEVGYSVECGDGEERVLFPYIHIISADYEEHCRFALNRGLRGLAPCPVCHIPAGVLSDIKAKYEFRTASDARDIVEGPDPPKVKEEALKYIGMRNIRNALWDIMNTDVHEAVSFDRLHAYIIGLWKQHLFEELKKILKELGRDAEVEFETIINSIPRWSKLAHFTSVLNIDFGDGNKWEAIAKIVMYAAYQILTRQRSPKGFALLRVIRKWIELNVLVSLDVQTEKTLAAYDRTLDKFYDYLEAYKDECLKDDDDHMKDWDGIIKVHSQTHVTRDIRLKGVASNMDTKPNEKLNGAMRNAYHLQTNFRNVEVQLGKLEDRSMVSCFIRGYIDTYDEQFNKDEEESGLTVQSEEAADADAPWVFNQITLRTRQPSVSVAAFIAQGGDDVAFSEFQQKLSGCIRDILMREHLDACARERNLSLSLPEVPPVSGSDSIVESRYVTVDYESKVTWRVATDRLRCSPSFFGRERYDCVISDWGGVGRNVICKLVRVFVYYANNGRRFGLALVQPLNNRVIRRAGDDELGLCRVSEKGRKDSLVIPVRSIIRGAVVVEDRLHAGEYTVMDTVDADMYLRMMEIFPGRIMETGI